MRTCREIQCPPYAIYVPLDQKSQKSTKKVTELKKILKKGNEAQKSTNNVNKLKKVLKSCDLKKSKIKWKFYVKKYSNKFSKKYSAK